MVALKDRSDVELIYRINLRRLAWILLGEAVKHLPNRVDVHVYQLALDAIEYSLNGPLRDTFHCLTYKRIVGGGAILLDQQDDVKTLSNGGGVSAV